MIASLAYALLTFVPIAAEPPQDQAPAEEPRLGLMGYCPVCLIEMKEWVPGKPEHEVVYDGHIYRFPGEEQMKMFQEDPEKYVPALHGDCVVCLKNMGKRVPGDPRFGRFYNGRVFFFPSEAQSRMFAEDPSAFADVDLALGGQCAVCRVEMGQDVPGKPEFTVHYKGLRYRFPGEEQMKMFQEDPEKYAVEAAPAPAPSEGSFLEKPEDPATAIRTVSIRGKTSCAGCEHGVSPLKTPDELGLAITAEDGTIYIVEEAHERFPELYENRFAGKLVSLTGSVLKREDRFVWVQPETLTVNQ